MNTERKDTIFKHIEKFLPEIIEIRHDLHAHPELAYEEVRTAAVVERELKKYGYDVATQIGKTGVVGQMKLGSGSKSIGLRADFDALPLQELTNLPYRSTYDGKMHACGHDGHTAILLAAARYFAETKKFNGTLNLIFQPAEEGYAGAKAMIDDGLFERFPCDVVYGLHNFPGLKFGSIQTRKGPLMPSSDTVTIRIIGRGGHGASPHLAVDPILIGSSIVMALQTVVSRNVSPFDTAVVTVGSFNAGHASNIIPNSAELILTVRSFSKEIRILLQKRITEIVKLQAESYGAVAEIDYNNLYPVLINHENETQYAYEKAKDLYGSDASINTERVSGSEDFAFMLEKRPGAYLFLGSGEGVELHNPHYDFNDDTILYGAAYWGYLVEKYLA